jgi:MFS family permease
MAGPAVAEGRRAWSIVAALAVTETVSWGILYYGFTAFLQPVSDDLGWSRGSMSAAFSVALLVQGAAAMVVGRWLDRHSPRMLMTVGSVAATVGVVAWSQVDRLWAFVVLWALLGGVMSTILYEPAFTVVTKWFREGRRRALTAVTLVAGLASTIFLPLENWLIETYGWRNALLILAVLLGVITVPLHALVLRTPPDLLPAPVVPVPVVPVGAAAGPGAQASSDGIDVAGGGDADVRSAVRSARFWFLAGAFVASSFVTSALAVHQVALFVDAGHPAAFAAGATGALGAMQLPGRLLFAPLERWLSRRATTVVVFGALNVGVAVLAVSTSVAAVWTFVVLYGMGRGMSTLLRATLVADLFGATNYGAIGGVLSACTTVATAAGPLVAGLLFDLSGNYDRLLFGLVGLAAVAVVFSALVERPRLVPGAGRRGVPSAT